MSISRRAYDYRVEEERRGASEEGVRAGMWTRYLVPLGRVAFAAVFIVFTPPDFTPQGIAEAAQQGVPLAPVLVPLAGLIALAGGASVILGRSLGSFWPTHRGSAPRCSSRISGRGRSASTSAPRRRGQRT